jgi:hypothetical protein
MLPQLKSWSTTLGHTAGLVTPNLSWFKHLSNGQVVEIWQNVDDPGYTATLIAPESGYKPGQLYVSGELVDHVVFTRWSQLVGSGLLAAA